MLTASHSIQPLNERGLNFAWAEYPLPRPAAFCILCGRTFSCPRCDAACWAEPPCRRASIGSNSDCLCLTRGFRLYRRRAPPGKFRQAFLAAFCRRVLRLELCGASLHLLRCRVARFDSAAVAKRHHLLPEHVPALHRSDERRVG